MLIFEVNKLTKSFEPNDFCEQEFANVGLSDDRINRFYGKIASNRIGNDVNVFIRFETLQKCLLL